MTLTTARDIAYNEMPVGLLPRGGASWLMRQEKDTAAPSAALNSSLPGGVRVLPAAAVNPWNLKNKAQYHREVSLKVANQLGKRYRCHVCGTEVLCTKASDSVITCCGREMEVQQPRTLPSSD